jgi:Zn-dependent protease with chaperone function
MPYLLLLVLYLACLGGPWPQPFWLDVPAELFGAVLGGGPDGELSAEGKNWVGVVWAGFLSWSALGGAVLAAFVATRLVRSRLRRDPQQRDAVARRYGQFRFWHLLGLFAVYILTLYLFGWGWAVQHVCTIDSWKVLAPGAEVVLLLPLVLALILSWACFFDADRALVETHPLAAPKSYFTRPAYVGFHLRQIMAMVLVPVLLLIFLLGIYRLDPDLFSRPWFQALPIGLLLVMIACHPWVLRLLLGFRPMPPGELRDRLLATARRVNFRCSAIMLWNTHNGVANALVLGAVPALRYVVLSDRLLTELSPDEVEAVFGHEAGHVKHHHIPYYFGFLLLSMAVLLAAFEKVEPYLHSEPRAAAEQVVETAAPAAARSGRPGREMPSWNWFTPLIVGSLGMYIFVVFGFLSRRCERQADIAGCRAVSCGQADCTGHEQTHLQAECRGLCPTGIRIFIRALEKVAALNGINRSRPGWLQSWQHSTIDRRVQFLQDIAADPTLEPRFQRRVRLVKWALIIVLVSLLGLIKLTLPGGTSNTQTPSAASASR